MKITRTWFTPALLTLALFAGACGKKNESGKSSGRFFGSVGTYTGVAPANSSNPYVQQVFSQVQCTTGGGYTGGNYNPNQRIGTGQQMNFAVAPNATYVGITAEGDISVLTGDNAGRAVLSLYICPRALGGTGAASMQQNPAYGVTYHGCRMDQITSATVYVPGPTGQPYTLAFFPIHFNPILRSSLCQY